MRYHERMVMLSVIDGLWKDHLLSMDHLKEGIGLRGYAQQDPLVAYKKESFDMFEAMMAQVPGRHGPVPLPHADSRSRRPAGELRARAAPRRSRGAPVASAEVRGDRSALPGWSAGVPGDGSSSPGEPAHPVTLDAEPREIPMPTRAPSTTIDALEKEFHRKKQRELEVATRAGAGESAQTTQRRTGEKVGRNDPCPCGSGKKYKKCHGAEK